jgi:hypothetical protein
MSDAADTPKSWAPMIAEAIRSLDDAMRLDDLYNEMSATLPGANGTQWYYWLGAIARSRGLYRRLNLRTTGAPVSPAISRGR